jgi:hypothetical protein
MVCQLSFQVLEGSVSCEYMLVFTIFKFSVCALYRYGFKIWTLVDYHVYITNFILLLLRNYDHFLFLKLLSKTLFLSRVISSLINWNKKTINLGIKIEKYRLQVNILALSISHLDVPAWVPGSGLSGWTAQEDLPRPEHVH